MIDRSWQVLGLVALAALAFGFCGSPALAVEFDNLAGGDWNTATNWNGDILPGDTTGPVTPDPEHAVIGDANFTGAVTVTLNAAPGLTPIGDLRIGQGPFGDGTFNHSAGDIVTVTGRPSDGGNAWSFIGSDGTDAAPAIGRYNMSGTATFTQSGAEFHMGIGGNAHPNNPNQGFLMVEDSAVFNGDSVFVGSNDTNYGQVDQLGGDVNINSWLSIGRQGGATGVYNMSGGTLDVTVDGITLGEIENSSGTFNLSGTGAVTTPFFRVGRGGNGGGTGDSTGLLTIEGSNASVSTHGFSVGASDAGFPTTPGEGTLAFTSDASGVTPIVVSNNAGDPNQNGDVFLNDGSGGAGTGFADLFVDLTTTSPPAGDILLIDIEGSLTGTFRGLAEGAPVPNSGGRFITYNFGGTGDIGLVTSVPSNDGDFNNDGVVNAADYTIWLDNFGNPSESVISGNGDGLNGVDQGDYALWKSNFQPGLGAGSVLGGGAVPEPTSALLALLGVLFAFATMRLKR